MVERGLSSFVFPKKMIFWFIISRLMLTTFADYLIDGDLYFWYNFKYHMLLMVTCKVWFLKPIAVSTVLMDILGYERVLGVILKRNSFTISYWICGISNLFSYYTFLKSLINIIFHNPFHVKGMSIGQYCLFMFVGCTFIRLQTRT